MNPANFSVLFYRSSFRQKGNSRWRKEKVFRGRAEHSEEVESRLRITNSKRNRADQYALEKLRATSGVPSRKRIYDDVDEVAFRRETNPQKRSRKAERDLFQ